MSKAVTSEASQETSVEQNSKHFYEAKHDLFFCTEVVKLAALASAMQHSLSMVENAAKIYPEWMQKIQPLCPGLNDWSEMPSESLHWSLCLAAQRLQDVSEVMESAFMAAEREGGAA